MYVKFEIASAGDQLL